MGRAQTGNFNAAIKGMARAARRRAFSRDMPVAISENGKTFLVFADGRKIPFTPAEMAKLRK